MNLRFAVDFGRLVSCGRGRGLLRFLAGLHLPLPRMKLDGRRRRAAGVRRRGGDGGARGTVGTFRATVLLILSGVLRVLFRLLYGRAGLGGGSCTRGFRRSGLTGVGSGRLRRRRVMSLLRRRVVRTIGGSISRQRRRVGVISITGRRDGFFRCCGTVTAVPSSIII